MSSVCEKQCEFSFLRRYKRISRSCKSYRTKLLFKAVKYRHKFLVQRLLKSGVNINAVIEQSQMKGVFHTYLMVNAIYGNSEITRMLIRAGCRLNTTTYGDCTALQFAIEFHNRGIAAELIASGADVNLKNTRGCTALHIAIAGATQIDRKAMEIQNRPYHPIRVLNDAKEFQSSLVQARISSIVQSLFRIGQERRVCLYLVKMLLNAGVEVNHKDNFGSSPIHYAACVASPELVKILIEAGADVDAQNNVGASALHGAVLYADEITARLLLSSGASVAIKTTRGNTALHWAVTLNDNCDNQAGIIRHLLVDFGSNINERNSDRETVIEMALGSTRGLVLGYVAEIETRTQKTMFDKHSLFFINLGNMNEAYEKVLIELNAMKKDTIGKTGIDFLTVLTEPLEAVSLLMSSNEEFLREFETSDYQIAYPRFASRLREKIIAATKCNEKHVKWQCKVDISCNI